MDLQKYEEALDNISKETIDKYFNADEAQYDFAKLRMLETFEKNSAEHLEIPTPFYAADKARLKTQIDILLAEDEVT